jgi:hypothetical protein
MAPLARGLAGDQRKAAMYYRQLLAAPSMRTASGKEVLEARLPGWGK